MSDLATPDDDDALLHLVGFRIDHWRFAVRLSQVKTSMLPCAITRVFHTPPFVQGIISLHGAIVCVLDLGRLLGLRTAAAKARRFLVLSDHGVDAAIPVHDVFRAPEISAQEIGPVPPHVMPPARSLLEGVINTASIANRVDQAGEDSITLLNAAMLFEAAPIRALRGLQ